MINNIEMMEENIKKGDLNTMKSYEDSNKTVKVKVQTEQEFQRMNSVPDEHLHTPSKDPDSKTNFGIIKAIQKPNETIAIDENIELIDKNMEVNTENTELIDAKRDLINTELIKENIDFIEGNTNVIKENTDLIKENIEAINENTDLIEENTNVINENTDLIEENNEMKSDEKSAEAFQYQEILDEKLIDEKENKSEIKSDYSIDKKEGPNFRAPLEGRAITQIPVRSN